MLKKLPLILVILIKLSIATFTIPPFYHTNSEMIKEIRKLVNESIYIETEYLKEGSDV